jgi:hypothetical protein
MASRNSKARMVHWKISYSKQLVRCSIFAQLLFTWLIPNADDLGRLEGDVEIIKGMIFPYHTNVSPKQIKEALQELSNEGLIIWYKANENLYIELPTFTKYQKLRGDRKHRSDYPSPANGSQCHDGDSQCHDMSGQDMTCHPEEKRREEKRREQNGSEGKKKYAEFVSMTEKECQELVNKFGEVATREMIHILDNYKGSKGKTYKSDYRAILSWVVKRYEEDQAKFKQTKPPEKDPDRFRDPIPECLERMPIISKEGVIIGWRTEGGEIIE